LRYVRIFHRDEARDYFRDASELELLLDLVPIDMYGVLLLSTPNRYILDLDTSGIRVQDQSYQGYPYPLKTGNTIPII
jgi:hypothetical protein